MSKFNSLFSSHWNLTRVKQLTHETNRFISISFSFKVYQTVLFYRYDDFIISSHKFRKSKDSVKQGFFHGI